MAVFFSKPTFDRCKFSLVIMRVAVCARWVPKQLTENHNTGAFAKQMGHTNTRIHTYAHTNLPLNGMITRLQITQCAKYREGRELHFSGIKHAQNHPRVTLKLLSPPPWRKPAVNGYSTPTQKYIYILALCPFLRKYDKPNNKSRS